MQSSFRKKFPTPHVVLPVIHVATERQALRNASIAYDAGADGVFLINHTTSSAELLDIHAAVAAAFPAWWIGVNCLDLEPRNVFGAVSRRVDGVWVDNAMIDEEGAEQTAGQRVLDAQREHGWNGLYFGGVAFKYQREVENLQAAARIARGYMDVVTTSGPGTGQAAHVEKIRTMKEALGDFPLAIASGITPDNISGYLPFSDCYLVATGISTDFDELSPKLTRRLVDAVRSYDNSRRNE